MSKRNFILLIIILFIAVVVILGFFYFQKGSTPGGKDGEGTNFISRFNPFGNKKPTPPPATPPTDVSGYQPSPPTEEIKLKLKKVSSMPIAGFTVFSKERLKEINPSLALPLTGEGKNSKTTKPTPPLTEFMPALRYVDRATGNIYQTFTDKIEERRFSTIIIPKIYEAYFGAKAESVVMRYLKEDGRTIQTFIGNLPKEYLGADATPDNEIKGSFLPEGIKDLSLSPDSLSIFYLFNIGDNMAGTTLNLLNNKKAQVFDSSFTEWLSFWPNSKMITLTTKPSSGIPGYMYGANPINNNNLSKVLGGINGLTTLTSPNGKLVLYGDDNLSLNVYRTDTKISEPLGVKTLPEKCVWSKAGEAVYCAVPKIINFGLYPDAWYQGEISFSDQFWKIDMKTGNATIILDPATEAGGGETDGIKLALDNDENYLFFVNKKDSFLWELKLK